ncbi:YjhT family mutarotase [Maritalea porphyrae]|uniref:YjhT family mutarotase n=1 Tax=Maritalea porphyrae TaxID=880732 RepID=UPI0022AF68D2|nr:YjhT family mutarotase [Maritalea porphyrae]MCZ4273416.1 YjhT family mutarotase [Maritalea porphyrae]
MPVGLKNGIAVKIGNQIFAGLGTAGNALYALDLDNPSAGWQDKAGFTGSAPAQPAFGISDGKLFVFSGSGKQTEADVAPIIFEDVHAYNPSSDTWQKIETKTPTGFLGASGLSLSDGRIAIVGGYNKKLFDKYLLEVLTTDKAAEPKKWNKIVGDYMGMEPADYLWNKQVWAFDPAKATWADLGENPYDPNTGSGIAALGSDNFMVINGEIKPGLRTDQVKSIAINSNDVSWTLNPALPAQDGSQVQEGLAAPYVGMATNGAVLVAGGANFPGARAKADRGEWFAHEGLSKTRADGVFAFQNDTWTQVGVLEEGLAYGASITLDGGVLFIGGEDNQGDARSDVFLLDWDGEQLRKTN